MKKLKMMLTNLKDIFIDKLEKNFKCAIGAYLNSKGNLLMVYVKLETDKWKVIDTIEAFVGESKSVEDVVAKIHELCRNKKWSTKILAYCLNNNKTIISTGDFTGVPNDKLANAVKYQIATTSNIEVDTLITSFMQVGNYTWIEGLPKSELNHYLKAFDKENFELRTLTAMPDEIYKVERIDIENVGEEFLSRGGINALFAIQSLIFQTQPNFLPEQTKNLNGLNTKLINLITISLTLITLLTLIFINFMNLKQADEDLQHEKRKIKYLEISKKKMNMTKKIRNELRNKNKTLAELRERVFPYRSLLIYLGTIKVQGVWLKGLNANDSSIDIEGEAINYQAMADYVKLFESETEIFDDVELKSSEVKDNKLIQFRIKLTI